MAISRMNMESQLRAGGGIMTLEEPRQGYFLGKIVRKAKKAVKKVVKSPLGKIALGAAALKFGGPGIAKLFGRSPTGFLSGRFMGDGGIFSAARGLFDKGRFLSPLVRDAEGNFSLGRAALTGLGATALAAPFLMGDEEEVDPGVDVTGIQPMVADIRNQAREFYRNPASRADSGLFFMPQQQFVQPSFFAAGGGLADIPREGYDQGKLVLGEGFKSKTLKRMAMDMFGKSLRELNADEMEMLREEFNISKGITDAKEGGIMRLGYNDGESVLSKKQMAMISDMKDKGIDMDTISSITGATTEQITNYLSSLNEKAEGGIMDLGGLEKDYREGGFVPIGAEERADDVPARLSKNEFVFTADAVRNAGGGDIDKGAEVMQNMMDNLEAGGMISEESQGKENPAQAMFDQAQMLESRIV